MRSLIWTQKELLNEPDGMRAWPCEQNQSRKQEMKMPLSFLRRLGEAVNPLVESLPFEELT